MRVPAFFGTENGPSANLLSENSGDVVRTFPKRKISLITTLLIYLVCAVVTGDTETTQPLFVYLPRSLYTPIPTLLAVGKRPCSGGAAASGSPFDAGSEAASGAGGGNDGEMYYFASNVT